MRAFKKILSLLLVLILAFSMTLPAFAEYDYLTTIEEGEVYSLLKSDEFDTYETVKFIPEQSGNYVVSSHDAAVFCVPSIAGAYPEGEIETGTMDFKYIFNFEAGTVYILTVYSFGEYVDSIKISIVKSCDHLNETEHAQIDPTCTEDGKTEGVSCADCGEWLVEPETIMKRHTDENGDRICDVCSLEALVGSGYVNDAHTASYKYYINGDYVVTGTGKVEYSFDYGVDDEWVIDESYVTKLIIGEGITEVDDYVFCWFSNAEIKLPSTLNHIGTYAFSSKVGFIPESVTSVGFCPYECEEYAVDENNAVFCSVDGVLFSKDRTELISYPYLREDKAYDVPQGVKVIKESAFEYTQLESVTFPEGLETIEANAFADSELKAINLPSTLKYIGECAFEYNYATYIAVPEGVEYIGENAFDDSKYLAVFNPECEIGYQYVEIIIGYAGSTAQELCEADGDITFLPLDEGHSHFYIPTVLEEATCRQKGKVSFSCPCGEVEARIVETEIREHNFYETDSGEECIWCGITSEDCWDDEDFDTENCTCICHRFDHSMSEDFFTGALKVTIMEIIRIFWKLFKTNEICECGMHHY